MTAMNITNAPTNWREKPSDDNINGCFIGTGWAMAADGKAFTLNRFSLTNDARDELHRRILPVVEWHRRGSRKAKLEKQDLIELASAVRDTFPYESLQALEDMAGGGTPRPVVIYNLPELPFDPALRDTRPEAREFASYYIAQGIYEVINARSADHDVLVRKPGRSRKAAPGGSMLHADGWRYSALSAYNPEEAATHFRNWRGVADQADEEGVLAGLHGDMGGRSINLQDYRRIGPETTPLGFRLRGDPSSPAVKRFNELLADHSASEVLMPNSIAIWNNHMIFHQAENGIFEHIPDNSYTRVAMFTSANRK